MKVAQPACTCMKHRFCHKQVNREETTTPTPAPMTTRMNQYSIELREELVRGDRRSLMKAAETLAFLVRDAAHVTPHNFKSCVHAIRVFVEASVNGGMHAECEN